MLRNRQSQTYQSRKKGHRAPLTVKALTRGLTARFAIGLDFFLTEPALLRQLLKLSKRHALLLYLSDSSETFHPKIYAFRGAEWCSVLVGSANLTNGGLSSNYEASAMIDDAAGVLMASVVRHFDDLVADQVIVLATKTRIDEYELGYVAHDAWRKVAKKRAEKLSLTDAPNYTLLRDILELMKEDNSEKGFEAQRLLRRRNRIQASATLSKLVKLNGKVVPNFLQRYEALIDQFHSGGLHRGKTIVAEYSEQFIASLAYVVRQRNANPGIAFDILHAHFREIPRAGINLLTEVLHALGNKRFAVMNQNAVSGMMKAGITDYPLHPTKQTVSGETYASYCHQANVVRQALDLADFTELDALFNYAYWGQDAGDDEP